MRKLLLQLNTALQNRSMLSLRNKPCKWKQLLVSSLSCKCVSVTCKSNILHLTSQVRKQYVNVKQKSLDEEVDMVKETFSERMTTVVFEMCMV